MLIKRMEWFITLPLRKEKMYSFVEKMGMQVL
jgi:hypothetical protein